MWKKVFSHAKYWSPHVEKNGCVEKSFSYVELLTSCVEKPLFYVEKNSLCRKSLFLCRITTPHVEKIIFYVEKLGFYVEKTI